MSCLQIFVELFGVVDTAFKTPYPVLAVVIDSNEQSEYGRSRWGRPGSLKYILCVGLVYDEHNEMKFVTDTMETYIFRGTADRSLRCHH